MSQPTTVSRKEAADRLGVSLPHFERHIQHEIPYVPSGRLRLYRPKDLERWADANIVDQTRAITA